MSRVAAIDHERLANSERDRLDSFVSRRINIADDNLRAALSKQ